ncbi:MAG: hypothetical protein VW551_00495 [Euryarchaeota archaeon]|jgi:hypothetical protein
MNKKREPNPLDFLEMRQLDLCPPHFEVTTVEPVYNIEHSLARWIKENLKGRFYVSKDVDLKSGSITNVIKIGFEEPKEASYFMLACPHLKYK